jgi:hypothetical protein
MRSWLKNISRIVLIFLIVFVSWHYFKKSASLIKQIKNKSVVMAYCMDGDTPVCDDSNSGDSGIEPEYKDIPRSETDPNYPQWLADLANENPIPGCSNCSRWEGDELHVFDEHGNLIRVWQPYAPYEDPSERDGDGGGGGGGQTCTLYCPASNAPACGGSCRGCYQWANCEEWDCNKPGCSCSCHGSGEDRYCNVSGSFAQMNLLQHKAMSACADKIRCRRRPAWRWLAATCSRPNLSPNRNKWSNQTI